MFFSRRHNGARVEPSRNANRAVGGAGGVGREGRFGVGGSRLAQLISRTFSICHLSVWVGTSLTSSRCATRKASHLHTLGLFDVF